MNHLLSPARRGLLSLGTSLLAGAIIAFPAYTQGQGTAVTKNQPAAPDPVVTAADQGRILGSEKATVWMLVVSDFQCPFCKQWHDETWEALKKEYVATGKIRVAYENYPLSQHANARPAAMAAMCAAAQGKFWQVADALFASQKVWEALKDPAPVIDGVLKKESLDAAKVQACMASKGVASIIEADQIRMAKLGINSTPTFFVGRTRMEGAQPLANFRKAIDAELAAAAAGKTR